MYENPPRFNETSVQRTDFASPLAPRYIEVPLYTEANLINSVIKSVIYKCAQLY